RYRSMHNAAFVGQRRYTVVLATPLSAATRSIVRRAKPSRRRMRLAAASARSRVLHGLPGRRDDGAARTGTTGISLRYVAYHSMRATGPRSSRVAWGGQSARSAAAGSTRAAREIGTSSAAAAHAA